MKKAKKILALLLCAILLVGATIAGTVAYLTDQDNVVENTFTVGKVVITMDEADVNEYGKLLYKTGATDAEGKPVLDTAVTGNIADRVVENSYKLVPGHTYTKDPTIHVAADSEACWLFVEINNQINATLDGQTGWTHINGNYWKYHRVVNPGEDVVVFDAFTYANNVTDTSGDAAKKIIVRAYAIQADGLDTVDAAWTALGLA